MALYIITNCDPQCSCGACGCTEEGFICCSACPPCSPQSSGGGSSDTASSAGSGSGPGSA